MEDLGSPEPIEGRDKPPLDPATWETIDVAQYHIHGRYTERLQQFVILGTPFSMVNLSRQIEEVTAAQSRIPPMPRPKQPTALCAVLRDYAKLLFATEASNYPSGTQLNGWLASLRVRIEDLIRRRIDQIEKVSESGNGLCYHASLERMESAIRDTLDKHIKEHMEARAKAEGAKETAVSADEPREPSLIDRADSASEDRKALLLSFKAKARNVGIRVTDEMVAKAARPGRWNDRTMVAWWKRNDARCKPVHDRAIHAVLVRDPAAVWPSLKR